MKVSDYDYQLPKELIAQFPTKERTASRLLKLASDGQLEDMRLASIDTEFNAGDLLVLNDTKVIPARLYGHKESGGKIEILLERIVSSSELLTQIRASRAPKIGQKIFIEGDGQAVLIVTGRKGDFFELNININGDIHDWFEQFGHMPLPPYINRADQSEDEERYQTVFAKEHGAVAAPTAGLHYDLDLLNRLEHKGIRIETITLHVGAGTYQPVKVDLIEEHKMHSEVICVNQNVCDAIIDTKKNGGRVVAVGTTVARSLETAARSVKSQDSVIEPYQGETDIFIYPGFNFKVVDLLQTNFHLPQSTLLMLVSAFAGKENILGAYEYAIKQQYRFFSYGDAMLLEKAVKSLSENE